jgi:MSHA biogenesis protein MshP
MKRRTFNQRGFAMIAAIFLLVVLAGLGVGMANFSLMQHTSSAMDVQGARAYQAARAGIEWGLYQSLILTPSVCPAGPISFVPATAPTLAGFTVTVTCVTTTNVNTAPPVTVMQLTSIACNQPDGSGNCTGAGGTIEDYVQRVVQAAFDLTPGAPMIYRRELY